MHVPEGHYLERIEASYYIIENDGSKTGPVCPYCYQRDVIVVLLTHYGRIWATCESCDRSYPDVAADSI